MPLLDSFAVDHTRMNAPAVRKAKVMNTPKGDKITVYDLRFFEPNKEMMSSEGAHTLEHLYAGFMRKHLTNIDVIDISPMGCRTGFYMSLIGEVDETTIAKAWQESMKDVLNVASQDDIPELNKYQCGTYQMHSLEAAKEIAQKILNRSIGVIDNHAIMLTGEQLKNLSKKGK